MISKIKLNKKIKSARMALGKTQEDMAKALFTTKSTISKWEKGSLIPSLENLEKISIFLEVEIDHLIKPDVVQNKKIEQNNFSDIPKKLRFEWGKVNDSQYPYIKHRNNWAKLLVAVSLILLILSVVFLWLFIKSTHTFQRNLLHMKLGISFCIISFSGLTFALVMKLNSSHHTRYNAKIKIYQTSIVCTNTQDKKIKTIHAKDIVNIKDEASITKVLVITLKDSKITLYGIDESVSKLIKVFIKGGHDEI